MTSIAVVQGSAGERALQAAHGTAERAQRFYDQQVLDHLNERMITFVRAQEMVFVATADAHGECDATFRAGPAGFVHVVGPTRLMWPEYRGNGVLASLGNISENAHVGLLFMDFVKDVIGLHVNGRATVMEDAQARAECPELPVDPVPGRRAERWVVVDVMEAYIHCAKHIPRMVKAPRERAWGTDDVRRKGGDFFGAAASQPERAERPEKEQNGDNRRGGAGRWRRLLRLPWRRGRSDVPDPSAGAPARGRRAG
ncbi:pyridoxamine 5'-phosphate oxidase family protein [Catellatospora bangladeshensis]|uniref:Hydrolase n=1 Tax=Catellatospora bangladeshensis TaxID=310355 RepID=A0A8J3JS64_9ACTN|nr:pyridoxamine 5'-phosphate oxidase family protein [Catellatospora bangladeshensis]GIF82224.1 hydrolase [Catellatospora bangladeshensis]